MPWFRVDDTLHSHPKTRRAGLAALGLWAIAGSYCCQYLTEGFVPDWFVKGQKNGVRLARNLVASGMWTRVEGTDSDSQTDSQPDSRLTHNPTHNRSKTDTKTGPRSAHESGYQFHDWHHFQMSKEEIVADRENNRERQRKFREKKREARNAVTNAVSNGGSNGTPTLPNPTHVVKAVSSEGYVSNAEAEPRLEDEPRSKPVDVNALKVARAYTDIVKLSDKGKVSAVVLNARNAGYTDEQITPALVRLANDGRGVSVDTLRIEIEGRGQNGSNTQPRNRGPKEIPGIPGVGMTMQL